MWLEYSRLASRGALPQWCSSLAFSCVPTHPLPSRSRKKGGWIPSSACQNNRSRLACVGGECGEATLAARSPSFHHVATQPSLVTPRAALPGSCGSHVFGLFGLDKMNEGAHVRGCSGHRTKPTASGRSAQKHPAQEVALPCCCIWVSARLRSRVAGALTGPVAGRSHRGSTSPAVRTALRGGRRGRRLRYDSGGDDGGHGGEGWRRGGYEGTTQTFARDHEQ